MKTRLRTLSATLAVAGLFSAASFSAHALGFGPIKVQSEYGQPLKAQVDLRLNGNEYVTDKLVTAVSISDYSKFDVPVSNALQSLKIDIRQVDEYRATAIITTDEPIRSNNFQFLLKADGANGTVFRSFNALLRSSALDGPAAKDIGSKSVAVTTNDLIAHDLMLADQAKKSKAQANFEKAAIVNSDIYLNIIELNKRPAAKSLHRVKANIKDESVLKALRTVVPKDWRAYAGDKKMNTSQHASFRGNNRIWLSVLDDVLTQTDLTATIDWSKKEITFRGINSIDVKEPVSPKAEEPHKPAEVVSSSVTAQPTTTTEAVVATEAVVTIPEVAQPAVVEAAPEQKSVAAEVQAPVEEGVYVYKGSFKPKSKDSRLKAQKQAHADAVARAQSQAQEQAKVEAHAQAQEQAKAAGLAKAKTEAAALQSKVMQTQPVKAETVKPAVVEASSVVKTAQPTPAPAPVVAPAPVQSVSVEATAAPVVEVPRVDVVSQETAPESKPAVVAESKVQEAPKFAGTVAKLEYFGKGAAPSHQVRSAGFNVELLDAVTRMIPADWGVFTQDQSLVRIDNVKWRGLGREWTDVLAEALGPVGVTAIINTTDKEVVLKSAK